MLTVFYYQTSIINPAECVTVWIMTDNCRSFEMMQTHFLCLLRSWVGGIMFSGCLIAFSDQLLLFYFNTEQLMPCCVNRDLLRDVIQMLHSTANTEVEHIVRTMKNWAKDNRIVV